MVSFITKLHAARVLAVRSFAHPLISELSLMHMHVAGEICTDWQTWSQFLNIRLLLGASLLQTLLYVSLAALFAGSSAVLVTFYAP